MEHRNQPLAQFVRIDRRRFLRGSATLSAAAIALLSGRRVRAAQGCAGDTAADVRILNTALAAELEAIAAYETGAGSGLLRPPLLAVAVQFQGHHKAHAQLLATTVSRLGGKPNEPLAQYAFPVEALKVEADVLRFAAGLEEAAVSAYLGAVPRFGDADLARAAASILGDEAMHWAILRQALGDEPVPAAFVG